MKFGLQITLSRKISRRYAQSLFDSASQKKLLMDVHKDLVLIENVIKDSEDLKDFIQQPYLALGLAEAVLGEIFKTRIEPLTYDFLLFLIHKGRLNILSETIEAFDWFYQQHQEISKVQITSASELSKVQVAAICEKLNKRWKREIVAETIVDPALIGGFRIKSGDQVLDFSMKNLLENYRRQVINA
jgi:F-type H+-transporting ATPase subunit delta